MKKLLFTFLLSLFSLSFFVSCGEDEVSCDHCIIDAPYSRIGSTNCYESLEACELAEGAPCEMCY